MKGINVVGVKYQSLTIVKSIEKTRPRQVECLCDCGETTVVEIHRLKKGFVSSCGCIKQNLIRPNTKPSKGKSHYNYNHGMTKNKLFNSWVSMMARCYNTQNIGYKNYGGRGIRVCDRWHDPRLFIQDIGYRPSDAFSLGRINNDGNYEPLNCRWEERKQQANNKRSSLFFTICCQRKTLLEWCEIYNVKYSMAYTRIKNGWSIDSALNKLLVTNPNKIAKR